jgi:hypothetical protein
MREFLVPHWVVGAISNAKWGGVKIRDVLKECGLDVDAMAMNELEIPGLEHVQFEAYDHDETGVHYGGYVNHLSIIEGSALAVVSTVCFSCSVLSSLQIRPCRQSCGCIWRCHLCL